MQKRRQILPDLENYCPATVECHDTKAENAGTHYCLALNYCWTFVFSVAFVNEAKNSEVKNPREMVKAILTRELPRRSYSGILA